MSAISRHGGGRKRQGLYHLSYRPYSSGKGPTHTVTSQSVLNLHPLHLPSALRGGQGALLCNEDVCPWEHVTRGLLNSVVYILQSLGKLSGQQRSLAAQPLPEQGEGGVVATGQGSEPQTCPLGAQASQEICSNSPNLVFPSL